MSETEPLEPCPKGCEGHPQHMALEVCRDFNSPHWNKKQSRVWCPSCGLTQIAADGEVKGESCIVTVTRRWNTRIGYVMTWAPDDDSLFLQFVAQNVSGQYAKRRLHRIATRLATGTMELAQ